MTRLCALLRRRRHLALPPAEPVGVQLCRLGYHDPVPARVPVEVCSLGPAVTCPGTHPGRRCRDCGAEWDALDGPPKGGA